MTDKSEFRTSVDGAGDGPKGNRQRSFQEIPFSTNSNNSHQSTPHPVTVKRSRGVFQTPYTHLKDISEAGLTDHVPRIFSNTTPIKPKETNSNVFLEDASLTESEKEVSSCNYGTSHSSFENTESFKASINKVVDDFQSSILTSIEEMRRSILQMIHDEISRKL